MSKLQELINELCPDGVEYKTIGELSSLVTKQTGFDYSNHIKSRLVMEQIPNSVPYIQTKFFTGKSFDYNTDYYVPYDVVDKFPKITLDEKCLLFSIVGASIGNVGLFPGDVKCFLGGAICVAKIKPEYNVDYLYYCIESSHIQHQIKRKTKGAGQATVTVEDIRNFTVPFPPLPIQEEIVRILDKMTGYVTELKTELNAELKARKMQYEYYRDDLLAFGSSASKGNLQGLIKEFCPDGVEYKKIEEVFDTITDYTAAGSFADVARNVKYLSVENYAQLIRTTDLKSNFKSKDKFIYIDEHAFEYLWRVNLNKIGIVMPNVGNCGEIYYIDPKCLPYKNNALGPNAIWLISKSYNNKFLYYWMQTSAFQDELSKITSSTGQTKFNKTNLKKIIIPVPPLPVQEEIVRILDKFSSICNDISSDLPAEIEARQKQYKYYRDKLLSFKEISHDAI